MIKLIALLQCVRCVANMKKVESQKLTGLEKFKAESPYQMAKSQAQTRQTNEQQLSYS